MCGRDGLLQIYRYVQKCVGVLRNETIETEISFCGRATVIHEDMKKYWYREGTQAGDTGQGHRRGTQAGDTGRDTGRGHRPGTQAGDTG